MRPTLGLTVPAVQPIQYTRGSSGSDDFQYCPATKLRLRTIDFLLLRKLGSREDSATFWSARWRYWLFFKATM
jgi:hypothetical protein